ncbi:hypothetical protein SBRCBS47491_007934 [Sporothrix bragantina]|uniref:Uncharacterized protein n=1 Tax=Sporothrix bragantina TaxID=671064 RepID=A0ABP0CJ80_9PEZI
MTGIIRFPRGSRPNKVTKPPVPPTRRVANGNGNGSGSSNANGSGATAPVSTSRQLAIEQALDEQQQQQQQYDVAAAATEATTGDAADHITPESAQALIQDGSFYNVPDQAQGDTTVAHDHSGGSSKAEPDDSNMIDLHGSSGGGGGGDGSGDNGDNGDNGGHHTENIVTDMDEAEMSEMVSGAVESYAEENGIGVPRAVTEATAPPPSTTTHGLDMDLSAAAAAAAAAAAVASASHLATAAGHNHHLRTETSSYSPQAQEPSTEHSASAELADGSTITPAPQMESATTPREVKGDAATVGHNAQGPETAPPGTAPSTTDMAHDSGYNHLPVESALAKRLAREPGLRLAHQRRPDQQLNLARRSNVEALFAHIAGEEVAVPCKNCHKGHGPWTACVVVDGQMCGSCANCWFNASGARCSFHETKTPMHGHSQRQSLGGGISVLPQAGPTSTLDPQLMGSPLGTAGLAAHHVAQHYTTAHHHHHQQQQHPHQHMNQNRQQHALGSSSLGLSQSPSVVAATTPSSAAQQAAAAAAAAAVAVQQLSNGGHHFPNLGTGAATSTATGASSTGTGHGLLSNGNSNISTSSLFNQDLITSLLGASRSGSNGDDAGSDAVSAETAPLVGLVINQALAEVRNADQRGRDLMLVEIAAKQLALAIVRFGEGAAAGGEAPPSVSGVLPGAAPAGSTDEAHSIQQHRDGASGGAE